MVKEKTMETVLVPEAWGLEVDQKGRLMIDGQSTVELAREFGTPLHVVSQHRLEATALKFRRLAESAYPGKVSVHYPFKCNAVPGVVDVIQRAGLKAEVMTEFELELAVSLGYREEEIIVNGPSKTEGFLRKCFDERVRLIVVDSLEELSAIGRLSDELGSEMNILLRVNPDYVPRGMNYGSATASRKGCAFGLDLKGGEVALAMDLLRTMPRVTFQGFHFHIGTGIRNMEDYANVLRCLPALRADASAARQAVRIIDVGGGFASASTREFTSLEMLAYQAFGNAPQWSNDRRAAGVAEFVSTISREVGAAFSDSELPELIYEPGRCITSPNQFLLLSVVRVKNRPGVGKWLIMDGGLSTVTMPTFYEYHEVFLCNDVYRSGRENVSIAGPACFAGDTIYRHKWMPPARSGEVLAIMDTGAYFTAFESSFGFALPAIVAVRNGTCQLIRARESFQDFIGRDRFPGSEHVIEEELS